MEDVFTHQLMDKFEETTNYNDYGEITYDKIPKFFSNIEEWTKSTNLKCWNCDCNFTNTPCFIPVVIDPAKSGKGIVLETCGNFCSFPCASSYITLHFYSDLWNKRTLLKLLYSKFHGGKKIMEIPEAPLKTLMKQYGGYMTVNEYRNVISELINKCHSDL